MQWLNSRGEGHCGKEGRYVYRDLKRGFPEPACPKCRKQTNVICADCGKEERFFSLTRCVECYCRDFIEERTREFIEILSHEWVWKLCTAFMRELCDNYRPSSARRHFRNYFEFSADVDAKIFGEWELTAETLLEVFGSHWARRWMVPVGYLVKKEVLTGDL